MNTLAVELKDELANLNKNTPLYNAFFLKIKNKKKLSLSIERYVSSINEIKSFFFIKRSFTNQIIIKFYVSPFYIIMHLPLHAILNVQINALLYLHYKHLSQLHFGSSTVRVTSKLSSVVSCDVVLF